MWKKVAISLGCVLLLLLIAGGVILFLITQDDSREKYQEASSTDLLTKAAIAAGTGEEISVEQKELNGLLAYLFEQKEKTENSQKTIDFNSLYVTLGREEGTAGIYTRCTCWGLEIGITARANIRFEKNAQRFCIQIEEMKAGRLSLPPAWTLSVIGNQLPEGVSVQDSQIYLSTELMYSHLDDLVRKIELQAFRIQDGAVHLRTTGALDALGEYLKEKLGEGGTQFGALLEEWGGKLKGFFSEFQE